MSLSTAPTGATGNTGAASAGGLSTEERLFEAMDRAALSLIEILDDNSTVNTGTAENPRMEPRYDLQTKLVCFEKGQAWLLRRSKLRPKQDDEEGALVQDMKTWMENPATRDMLKKSLFDMGVVIEPERKPGRPRKEEMPARRRFESYKQSRRDVDDGEDDSGWQKMLGKGAE